MNKVIEEIKLRGSAIKEYLDEFFSWGQFNITFSKYLMLLRREMKFYKSYTLYDMLMIDLIYASHYRDHKIHFINDD
jgi:hypothetical protein